MFVWEGEIGFGFETGGVLRMLPRPLKGIQRAEPLKGSYTGPIVAKASIWGFYLFGSLCSAV